MALMRQSPVMDITPWPRGQGFTGANAWWDYMMSKEERRRLDNLLGVALLDEDIRTRLVSKRDDSLLEKFGLSEKTRSRLRDIQASSLADLAQQIMSEPQPGHSLLEEMG